VGRLGSLLAIRCVPPFMPKALIPTIGVVETELEFTLALALLGGSINA
jgi:hypothetical protein